MVKKWNQKNHQSSKYFLRRDGRSNLNRRSSGMPEHLKAGFLLIYCAFHAVSKKKNRKLK